jgi:uncharacterized protein (DUF305 family)
MEFSMSKSALLMVAALIAAPVLAQQTMDHSKMDHSKTSPAEHGSIGQHGQATGQSGTGRMDHARMNPAEHARMMGAKSPYMQAEMDMHHRMMRATGSNADIMWARKMIEHHQGAIDMSRILLAQGKDAEAKRMAQTMIDSQQKEIAKLRDWLRRHGG